MISQAVCAGNTSIRYRHATNVVLVEPEVAQAYLDSKSVPSRHSCHREVDGHSQTHLIYVP